MLLTVWKDENGYMNNVLYENRKQFIKDTFCPLCDIISVVELKVHGSNYKSRKESAREIAQEIQRNDIGGLTWGELQDIQWFLLNIGKRYGLLKEFYENGLL